MRRIRWIFVAFSLAFGAALWPRFTARAAAKQPPTLAQLFAKRNVMIPMRDGGSGGFLHTVGQKRRIDLR